MSDFVFTFDPDAPEGEKLAPEVRAEIAYLAPSTLNDNAVTTPKILDEAVTNPKLAPGAVRSENIEDGEVKTANLNTGAVTSIKIAAGAVTPDKAGQGVVTAEDADGAPVAAYLVPIAADDHAAIVTADPAAVYLVLED